MSEFMRGFLLGGGNVFGSSSSPASGGDGGAASWARVENMQLREQIRGLRAELAGVEAIRDALMTALHQALPGHPLVSPFEPGQNPRRNALYDEAYDAELEKVAREETAEAQRIEDALKAERHARGEFTKEERDQQFLERVRNAPRFF